MTTRILVTGSRRWWDRWTLWRRLDQVLEEHGPLTIVHGAACGLDDLARWWADRRGQAHEPYRADWHTYGKRAGPRRNQEMVADGAAVCLAWPDPESRGTVDCIWRAREARIPTEVCPTTRPEVEVLCDRLLSLDPVRWAQLARWMRYREDVSGWGAVEELMYRALFEAERSGDGLTIQLLAPWAWPEPPEVLAYRPDWIALRASARIEQRVTWRRRPRPDGSRAPALLDFRSDGPKGRRSHLVAPSRCEEAPLEIVESLVAALAPPDRFAVDDPPQWWEQVRRLLADVLATPITATPDAYTADRWWFSRPSWGPTHPMPELDRATFEADGLAACVERIVSYFRQGMSSPSA